MPLLCVTVRVSMLSASLGHVQFSSVCMQSCFWGTWCRLQPSRHCSALTPLSYPFSVPTSSAGSVISKWIPHLCHCWCESHTTSLVLWQQQVLPLSHSQVHCGLSVNIPNYKRQQNNCDLSAFIGFEAHINFIFQNSVITSLQTPLSLAKWRWNLGFWLSKMSNTGLNLSVLCPIILFPINCSAPYSVNIMPPLREWRGNYRGGEGGNTHSWWQ